MSEDSKTNFTPEEQQQINERWTELEKLFEQHKRHVVCAKVLLVLLAEDMVTYRKQWTKEMVNEWWKLLEATHAEKTHKKALEDLIYLAAFVDHDLERTELGVGMLVLINEAVEKWKLVDMEVDAKFEAASEERQNVTGAQGRPIPAKVGEKPPEGALRPDQLGKGPRRI